MTAAITPMVIDTAASLAAARRARPFFAERSRFNVPLSFSCKKIRKHTKNWLEDELTPDVAGVLLVSEDVEFTRFD